MKRSIATIFAGALAATLLAGPTALAADAFELAIKDHRFEPAELKVPANKKVALTVKNLDPSPEEFESNDLRREKVIPGGQQATIYIGPLKPGRYEFFGEFNPKTARGFIVVE
jgi:plastocyanin domain-containing protein